MPVRPELSSVAADLRMALPAVAAWSTAAAAVAIPPTAALIVSVVAVLVAVASARWTRPIVCLVAVLVAGVALVCAARVGGTHSGSVPDLAERRATVSVRMQVDSDPRLVHTPHRDLVVFDATVRRLSSRGAISTARSPVVVWTPATMTAPVLGTTVEAVGRLAPAPDSEHSASLQVSRLRTVGAAPWWWTASARVRSAVAAAVDGQPADVRALVPALVHGDDRGLSDDLKQDFRDSGLTHLLAVSGTNLTLVVGFLLVVTRPLGARGRSRVVVGVLGTIAFVLLARPEPSVVRAAVMGVVALIGLGSGGRRRGVRCLAWAIVLIVLVDPWLARSAGFLLSSLATAGIVVLAPSWCDSLVRWMPRWCAEALSVPMSAQLVCTPVIAAISGQVSLVAVGANVLAAPAVGPATVLGLLAGIAQLVSEPLGGVCGLGAGLFARWIITIGRHGADLPGAAVEWGSGSAAIVVLVVVCAITASGARSVLRRPLACCAVVSLTVLVLLRPVSFGWPPPGWVMIACDVGQGDATVLNAGDHSALVVDAGPDPRLVDRCLRRLDVRHVPLVVLTHGHADHVDGLPGVLHGRDVAEIEVGPGGAPALPPGPRRRDVAYGETRRLGGLSWTVLSPMSMTPVALDASNGEGSAANDASIVLLLTVRGISILLTGDAEPLAQAALERRHPDLHVDVLKVPHHGSARQDAPWFASLRARYGTLSAGVDNTFGHPSPKTISLLGGIGTTPLRTDTQGDLAIIVRHGRISAETSR